METFLSVILDTCRNIWKHVRVAFTILFRSGVYAIEMTARVYVFRMDVFRTGMLFDFLIAGNSAETKEEVLRART